MRRGYSQSVGIEPRRFLDGRAPASSQARTRGQLEDAIVRVRYSAGTVREVDDPRADVRDTVAALARDLDQVVRDLEALDTMVAAGIVQ